MPRLLWLVAAFAERLLASQPGTSFKSTNAVYNNRDNYYFDIDGNAITSTNGKVQWIKDQYLWVAEPMCRSFDSVFGLSSTFLTLYSMWTAVVRQDFLHLQ